MGGNRIVLATLVGAVVAFLVGGLIWGAAFVGFFEANAGTAMGAMKETPGFVAIALGQIPASLLLTLIIQRWGSSTSIAGGAKVGALFGFLVALSYDLTMYGSTNLMNLTATLVDPVLSMVHGAVVGAAIGMVLGRGTTLGAQGA
jgi:uncharacterized membrane protein